MHSDKFSTQKQFPLVSLLIAMKNEADYIERCLASIIDQDYPQDYLEVFVLDGESTDNSWDIVAKLINGRLNYYLVCNPDIIQAAAWNLGIQLSKGEVIGIVSAHSELSSDYISKAIETLHRTNADMVGGTVRACNQGWVGETIALAISTPFGVGNANFRFTEKEQETDTVFMGLCYRSLYLQIGSFDNELVRNQDDELSYRLIKNGGRIVCNPFIRSSYFSRANLHSLCCQYFHYGYWKVRVLQKHPRQMRLRQFVPPIFVATLIGLFVLALFLPLGRYLFALIIGLYILANLVASLWTSAHRGWRHLPLLPLVYAILHISYGLGFLAGLVKFANRWGDKVGKVPSWSDEKIFKVRS